MSSRPLKILFTGYAPVHYACFRPLHERLSALSGVEVFVSGGLRSKTDNGYDYDGPAMYDQFDLNSNSIPSVDEIKTQDFDILFAANTKMILPQSVSTKIQIFHGCSFRNKAIRPENGYADYWFMLGPYMSRKFDEAGILSKGDPRTVPIGFMKTDRLVDTSFDRGAVLETFGFDGDRPVLLFAPTGARKNAMEVMGEAVIERLAATDRYNLLIKTHDHPKNKEIDWHQRLARFESSQCKISTDPDVVRLLSAADLLISDASSVSSEFTLTDRPIVFLDTPELIAKAETADNSMADVETWGRKCGLIVRTPEQVVGAVDHALRNPKELSPVRRAMAKDLFYNPGRATDAAMSWLKANLIDRRGSVAA